MKKIIKQLAYDLVNDEVFVNTSVDRIISVVENVYSMKDIDMSELRKYINIEQRTKKLEHLDEKILESKI